VRGSEPGTFTCRGIKILRGTRSGGLRINLPLPDLYNPEQDHDESYAVAAGNPALVADIHARIVKALPGFPSAVMQA
jgi:hypothetical protein